MWKDEILSRTSIRKIEVTKSEFVEPLFYGKFYE